MKQPYLIQRARFYNRTDKTGIDNILQFDYMGSAEFEFGALPASLKRVRANINNYILFQHTFKKDNSKIVSVFCTKEQKEFVGNILEQLADREIRLKEYCDLDRFVSGFEQRNDFWWDIDYDWFFWKQNDEFDSQFKTALNIK